MSNTKNYKRTPKRKTSNSGNVSVSGKRTKRAVPQNNVLDLRSIIAKREAQQQRKTAASQPKKKPLKRKRSKKKPAKQHISYRIGAATARTVDWLKKPFINTPNTLKRVQKATTAKKPRKNTKKASKKKKRTTKKTVPVVGVFPGYAKSLGVFVLLALIIVVPANVSAMLGQSTALEDAVITSSEEGFVYLQNAATAVEQFNFEQAEEEFANARYQFELAEKEVNSINGAARALAPYIPGKGKQFAAGSQLIIAGKEISAAGEQISAAMSVITAADFEQTVSGEGTDLTNLLLVAHAGLSDASGHIEAAATALQAVDVTGVPENRRDYVVQAQQLIPAAEAGLLEGVEMVELLLAFLGHDEEQRHLVLFGNNREIRPCAGGFIGSIGIFDVAQGNVSTVDIPGGGIYDIAGQTRTKVIAPQPLHLINPHWNVQDANWFPHYPECANKIQAFLEDNNNNFSVDIVSSMTPDVVEEILRITGPINLKKKYGTVISSDNFYDVVQDLAEQKFDETPESKQIIADMTPLLFQQLFEKAENPDELLELLTVLRTALDQKDIVVYANEEHLQEMFSGRNWAGELMETDGSYLHMSVANIGGGKTSKVIDNTADIQTRIEDDGTVIERVTFTRVHKGPQDHEYHGLDNFAFVRAYIPAGSEILSVEGFDQPNNQLFKTPEQGYVQDEDLQRVSGEISLNPQTNVYTNEEFGKQVVGGWMITERGKSSEITIEYRLPDKLNVGGLLDSSDNYSLLIQKQSGLDMVVRHSVDLPDSYIVEYSYPEAGNTEKQLLLESDYFTGIVLSEVN